DGSGLDVSPTTGGIRGIVVDQAIVPVNGAKITLSGGKNTTSDEEGLFRFTGLEPGDYFVSVAKPGYTAVQQSASVVAGVADPPIVKVLLTRLTTAQPYLDHFKLDGFYECAFSYGDPGNPFITDSCDMAVRTAYDGVNETTGSPPPFLPRNVQRNINTQFLDVPMDTYSIVQEGYWTDEAVPVMMILLSSTPIDNACDCSDKDYMDVTMANPTYNRIDRFDEAGKDTEAVPLGESVAARGFLSWEAKSTAQNLRFTVITTMFHNYVAPEGWTFETKDQYQIG
ncbi:MAG: Carboxypeptidase regulatory-like domain, partial [Thermoplasmata archaeon]|nr:Carboxypeptidase regulatory-like domain [Thermoplasmata archaeon]